MNRTLIFINLLVSLMVSSCRQKSIVFPNEQWQYLNAVELNNRNWEAIKIQEAKQYSKKNGSLSWMLIENGTVVDTFGNVSNKIIVQSVRKSFLSALYGIQVQNDQIDINKNLSQLKIDDFPNKLSSVEKEATIKHLLESRSGIYIIAASSPEHMVNNLPKRHLYKPGEHWYYNNWDFNTLGTIYMNQTNEDIFESFKQHIANPIQMKDFNTSDCYYHKDSISVHKAYHFSMSVRDMARFGLLYLEDGKWNEKQIINSNWIKESTFPYTLDKNEGYGYMWWIEPKLGSFSARGGSGQLILIIPDKNIVFVHSVDRHDPKSANWKDISVLIKTLLNAKK